MGENAPRPLAAGRWGPGAWTVWGTAVALGLLGALVAVFLATWTAAPGCGAPATSANVRSGLSLLGWAGLLLGAPWVVAAGLRPRRWPFMLGGLLVTLVPLAVMAMTHTHPTAWHATFCY